MPDGYAMRLAKATIYTTVRGIELPLRWRTAVRGGDHAPIFSYATYSPWLVDEEFQRLHEQIAPHTLVDVLRCYELWQLVQQVRDVPGGFLEVGVWRGGTGALIATRAARLGIEDAVHLCDTFEGVVKTGAVDTYYAGGEHDDTSAQHVRDLLGRLGVTNAEVHVGIYPDDTGAATPDTLRFVHIDVDVYESAREVLAHTWDRLSPGGIVVFDDYGFVSTPGVRKLVDEQRELPGRVVFHNLNGHGILVKLGA